METRVLPEEFGARFRAVADFRNVLVHGYLEVDLEVAANALDQHLEEFEEFAHYAERWITE